MLYLKMSIGAIVLLCSYCLGCNSDLAIQSGDFEAPFILSHSLESMPVLSPTDSIHIRFSEAVVIDEVGADVAAIVPFELGGECTVDLSCDGGSCYEGRCQKDSVDANWLADFRRPPLSMTRAEKKIATVISLSEGGDELAIQVDQIMGPKQRHSLLISPQISDQSGNPLTVGRDDLGLRITFATRGIEAARPLLALAFPSPGTADLPTNVQRLRLRTSVPLNNLHDGAFWLAGSTGSRVPLIGAHQRCHSDSGGPCDIWLDVSKRLRSLETWRLGVDPSVRDKNGRAAFFSAEKMQIATGKTADSSKPTAVEARARVVGQCIIVRASFDENVLLTLTKSWDREGSARDQVQEVELATDFERVLSTAGLTRGTLTLGGIDAAGNRSEMMSFDLAVESVPNVAITEVLANPKGLEPNREFVEIYNYGKIPVNLEDWTIDDGDDEIGARALPQMILEPGHYAVIVGKGYSEAGGDSVVLGENASYVRLDQTIGSRGLANKGESVVLRSADGQLISRYGGYLRSDTSADDGRSVERVAADACDIMSSWRYNRKGASTPGYGVSSRSLGN